MRRIPAIALAALACACGSSGSRGGGAPPPAPADPPETPPSVPPPAPGWTVAAREDFGAPALPTGAAFAPDPVPDDGPYADGGAFFRARGVEPPAAYRASAPFGADGWLTLESYTRRAGAVIEELADVVADPADPTNRVLRIRSPEHTDATVIRPTRPLPPRYRVSLRVGFASFGDGRPGLNGHDGGERAGPWWPQDDATRQNGFYWLAILDHLPRPHNNTWIHHHRKLAVDSDNHEPPWMEIWDGERFLWSGERPIMVIALDGRRTVDAQSGNAFLSWSAGAWQPSGAVRAVDAYVPGAWYRVAIERDGPRFAVEIAGRFRFGGERVYRAEIDAAAACLWHYPASAEEAGAATGCEDPSPLPGVGPEHPRWPAGGVWPEWFMLGDPHANYYEGEVLYDDLTLEVWR